MEFSFLCWLFYGMHYDFSDVYKLEYPECEEKF